MIEQWYVVSGCKTYGVAAVPEFRGIPYTRGTRIPSLLGVRNYLTNYFANYTHLTYSHIRVELASSAFSGLGII